MTKGFRYWASIIVLVVLTLPIAIIWIPLTFVLAAAIRLGFICATGTAVSHRDARRLVAELL